MIQLTNAVNFFKKLILSELKENRITCWVGGGSVRDYFSNITKPTDYDLFFPNQDEYSRARDYLVLNGAKIRWESDNGVKLIYNNKTFDLVKIFFDNPTDCINAFDFTVSMFAVDFDRVYYGESSFIDLAKKQIMINKITFPASTMSRAFRYHKKGFSMCLNEMKKLIISIQDMPKQEQKNNDEDDQNEENKSSGFDFAADSISDML